MNLLSYISAFRQVYKEVNIQKQYNKTYLLPYLQELENRYHGSFQPEQRRKITDYYGLFITSFLCSSYKKLYGKILTGAERKRATLFGILTPVGDDLFDIDQLNHADIERITYEPENYTATTFSAHVAKEIQTSLLKEVPHKAAYLEASKNVLDIQVETARQKNASITATEIEHITYTKGAVSVIIYHQCLDDAASEQMLDALFYTGSLYQLGNDLFDLYKDVRDNIYTLINKCDDYAALQQKFTERVTLQNRKIMALPYAKKDKDIFCIIMNTINARSMVALDQFVAFEKKHGKPDWWKLKRKDMIVDMEKPINLLKWFYYIWKLPRLI
ncbi:hypothetical protein I5907_10250 [Panacibacter sp. DH6]|uniref:Uncharacterized protein n=1 Tax=Panacibacter microcysteis TaxID=2793269 RepID=A0A931GYL4_9BACT|nr:hypothetical protein [Panacibacter microcysteis]MBG9376617.1 hypothetical protein [Panacibacter microcysteis]